MRRAAMLALAVGIYFAWQEGDQGLLWLGGYMVVVVGLVFALRPRRPRPYRAARRTPRWYVGASVRVLGPIRAGAYRRVGR